MTLKGGARGPREEGDSLYRADSTVSRAAELTVHLETR